jgi:hypothetical protein
MTMGPRGPVNAVMGNDLMVMGIGSSGRRAHRETLNAATIGFLARHDLAAEGRLDWLL